MRLLSCIGCSLAASLVAAFNYTTATGDIIVLPDEPFEYDPAIGNLTAFAQPKISEDVRGFLNKLLSNSKVEPIRGADEGTTGDKEDWLMRLHYGLGFDKRYAFEKAGDPGCMPGGCQGMLMPKYPRGVSYPDETKIFFCIFSNNKGCNRKDPWLYLPMRPGGYPNLGEWGWDRRAQSYRCYWGYDCGDECKKD